MLTELSLCPMISATCKLIFIWMIMVRACWCCNSSFKLPITFNFLYKIVSQSWDCLCTIPYPLILRLFCLCTITFISKLFLNHVIICRQWNVIVGV
jgi:hypothetical protein